MKSLRLPVSCSARADDRVLACEGAKWSVLAERLPEQDGSGRRRKGRAGDGHGERELQNGTCSTVTRIQANFALFVPPLFLLNL